MRQEGGPGLSLTVADLNYVTLKGHVHTLHMVESCLVYCVVILFRESA